jgi:hypothetical protein
MVFYELLAPTPSGLHRSLEFTPDEQRPGSGLLVIYCGNQENRYSVREFGCDWDGRAFRLLKCGRTEHYSVFLGREGHAHLCDCKGFTAHDHCKHLDALLVLRDQGWLDISPVNPDQDVSNTEPREDEPDPCG